MLQKTNNIKKKKQHVYKTVLLLTGSPGIGGGHPEGEVSSQEKLQHELMWGLEGGVWWQRHLHLTREVELFQCCITDIILRTSY